MSELFGPLWSAIVEIDSVIAVIFLVIGALSAIGAWQKTLKRFFVHRISGIRPEDYDTLSAAKEAIKVARSDTLNLWGMKPPQFPDPGALAPAPQWPKIVSFVNLKGGVGKTTLAANLAAFFSQRTSVATGQRLRVLIMDLDFQGSLSASLLGAAGSAVPTAGISWWFGDAASPSALKTNSDSLNPVMPTSRLVPSDARLASLENRLLLRWILDDTEDDIRFRLLKLLRSAQCAAAYDLVILDCPPRLTTASIAALAASTHYLIPTIFDRMSTQPILGLIQQVETLTGTWPTTPKFAGVVGCRTWRKKNPGVTQRQVRDDLREILSGEGYFDAILTHHVPNLTAISEVAGTGVAYPLPDDLPAGASVDVVEVRQIFAELGYEIAEKLGMAIN